MKGRGREEPGEGSGRERRGREERGGEEKGGEGKGGKEKGSKLKMPPTGLQGVGWARKDGRCAPHPFLLLPPSLRSLYFSSNCPAPSSQSPFPSNNSHFTDFHVKQTLTLVAIIEDFSPI